METSNETARLIVDERYLSTFATGTLIGGLLTQLGQLPKVLVLEFLQTSYGWRERHGGPASWAMNEFVIPCLMADVIKLRDYGVIVEIITTTRDPSP
jgi:hypothetical protein